MTGPILSDRLFRAGFGPRCRPWLVGVDTDDLGWPLVEPAFALGQRPARRQAEDAEHHRLDESAALGGSDHQRSRPGPGVGRAARYLGGIALEHLREDGAGGFSVPHAKLGAEEVRLV